MSCGCKDRPPDRSAVCSFATLRKQIRRHVSTTLVTGRPKSCSSGWAHSHLTVACHLGALIPGDRAHQTRWQVLQPLGQCSAHGHSVAARQVQQADDAAVPFDERAYCGQSFLPDDVGVGPGRGAGIAPGPFPRPALRTGRATLIASGAPRTATVRREPTFPSWTMVWGCCSPATDTE